MELRQLLPKELSAVDDLAAAQVKDVDRKHVILEVVAEDVGIVAFSGGNALFLLQLVHGGKQIAVAGGAFVLFRLRGLLHARPEGLGKIRLPAFEQQLHIANGLLVGLRRGQALYAWPLAALDVVLEARPRMISGQVHAAGGNQKMAVNQVNDAIGQIPGKVWPVVHAAILAQPARNVNTRKAFSQCELDVRIRLVVAQEDVESRLFLLDQIVFKGQRLLVIGDDDVLKIHSLTQQGSGLGIGLAYPLLEIRAHPGAEVLGLTHIDDAALGILVEVDPGLGRQTANFLEQIHGRDAWTRNTSSDYGNSS